MSTAVATKQAEAPANLPAVAKPADAIRVALDKMAPQFRMALPAHVPVERFQRVVMTAINQNPALLEADRKSLFGSCMNAAQDGLLPDGREAAFVVFNTKTRDQGWVKIVQYMPMIGGILKKIRNSGELLTIAAHVVYERDQFEYALGDDERIEHRPYLGDDRGKPIAVYAVAKTKDGGVYREVMTVGEVEAVRAVSRAKDKGPWVDWWTEMARKTVLRRLSKRLPMSTDLEELMRRDDDLYMPEGAHGVRAIDGHAEHQPEAPAPSKLERFEAAAEPETVGEMVDQMPAAEAEPPAEPEGDYVAEQPEIDPETGEIAEGKPEEPSDDLKALHAELMAGLRNELGDAAVKEYLEVNARDVDALKRGAPELYAELIAEANARAKRRK